MICGAGIKPAPHFFCKNQIKRENEIPALASADHEISENPMESEFCILNVVSRIEAVANATRGGESQCEGAGRHDPAVTNFPECLV
jgi:hypothetical protein